MDRVDEEAEGWRWFISVQIGHLTVRSIKKGYNEIWCSKKSAPISQGP